MNYVDEEIPRHKKKSRAKPPKKSSHKHKLEQCLIEYPDDWWKKEHERSGKTRFAFCGYCPICGKVGNIDQTRWWMKVPKYIGGFNVYDETPTEEGAKELNPETRTLPVFQHNDIFPKFVKID